MVKGKAGRRPLAVPTLISDLVPDPENRRKHNTRNIGMVADSLRQVGAARSIVIDEKNVILAGNGVTAAAAEAGITKIRVIDAAGDELIAVRRTGLSKSQKRDLAIADNRAAELAEWNPDQLRDDQSAGLTFEPWFSKSELSALIPKDVLAGQSDPNGIPSTRRTSIKVGDLFELGAHRLLCGDCTDPVAVERLMAGEKAGLMNTDPPYGIDFDNASLGPTRKSYGAIANDKQESGDSLQRFLESAFGVGKLVALGETAAWYLWHAQLTQGYFAAAAAAAAANLVLHRQIIWVKPRLILGRGQYHWKHELCFMGWVDGHQCPDYGLGRGERTQTTVWEIDGVSQAERDEFDHASPKPVELFKIPIVKHLLVGEACYEPFAGSGPQFIAAEQHGVRCFGLELEPKFCQVIIDRWEAFTGLKAKKVRGK